MPRKGAELWTGRRSPGEGAAGVPWCPSSFFLGPCLPRQHPHGRDRLLLRVPLPGSPTLSLLPPHASDTHSGEGGVITAPCPSRPNAGLQVQGEGEAGKHYCSKTDSDKRRRVTMYSDSSRSERCGKKQKSPRGGGHWCPAASPSSDTTQCSVGSGGQAWCRGLPHPLQAPRRGPDGRQRGPGCPRTAWCPRPSRRPLLPSHHTVLPRRPRTLDSGLWRAHLPANLGSPCSLGVSGAGTGAHVRGGPRTVLGG